MSETNPNCSINFLHDVETFMSLINKTVEREKFIVSLQEQIKKLELENEKLKKLNLSLFT